MEASGVEFRRSKSERAARAMSSIVVMVTVSMVALGGGYGGVIEWKYHCYRKC